MGGFVIATCARCSHQYVADAVPDGLLEEAYGAEYFDSRRIGGSTSGQGYRDYLADMDRRIAAFAERLGRIEHFVDTRGRLLDYGCAVGLFVKVAASAGWDAVGYERSAWAVKYGREVLGVPIELGNGTQNPYEPESFDVVTLWDTLEHLAEPRQVLTLVRGWLRPGGLLGLNTVNASSLGARLARREWRHFCPPLHLQFFTRRSLVWLLREIGFEVRAISGHGNVLKSKRGDRPLVTALRPVERLLTHWRAHRVATALNLLDELEVIAVKV